MESFDLLMEDYTLDYESSGIYEGPFDNVMVYDHQHTPAPRHNPFFEEESSPQYSPTEGLHTSEDSFHILSPQALALGNVPMPLFSTPQVGNSTSKNNCSTSLSYSRNSHQSTYKNASVFTSREMYENSNYSGGENSNCSRDENSYRNNQINENLPDISTNFFHTESANICSPAYSPTLQGNFSQTLSTTMACTSIPTTTVSFSPTDSTAVNSSFQNSTSTTCGFLSPSFSPRSDPSNYNFQMATPILPNLPPSLLPTPPCSPQETDELETELVREQESESLNSVPEFKFRSQKDVVAFIDNYFKNALPEESSNVHGAIEGYREHINSVESIKTEDERHLSNIPSNASERFDLPQTIDEWEYFPETPGFSDEDRANSPSQNLATPPPPPFMNDPLKLQRSQNLATPPPPSLINDPLKLQCSQNLTTPPPPFLNDPLQLQRTQTAVDFEHNYCGNGPSRSQAHVLMSPPYTDRAPTTSSDHVKRQLKNAIYGKNVQKRKVGRPPKSSYKVQAGGPAHVGPDKIKTLAKPTQGKPEAYTRRMREEHDEKIKMTATAGRSSTKNSIIRRRRTTANDPNDDIERRVNHNTMERTRRDFIKQNFERVRDLVPELAEQKKASKATILNESRNYIMELRHTFAIKDKELEQLRKRKIELQRMFQAALKTARSSPS